MILLTIKEKRTVTISISGFKIHGRQIELLSMRDQIQSITKTDILLGMHGAALTHAMYLPDHAGLIELRPRYHTAESRHFEAIARWRRIHYLRWINTDTRNEVKKFMTSIPPTVIIELVGKMYHKMCSPADNGLR